MGKEAQVKVAKAQVNRATAAPELAPHCYCRHTRVGGLMERRRHRAAGAERIQRARHRIRRCPVLLIVQL